jgi:hypothetical protein
MILTIIKPIRLLQAAASIAVGINGVTVGV